MKQRNHFSTLALGITAAALLTAGVTHADPVRKEISSSVSRSGPNHSMARDTKLSASENALKRQHALTVDGKTAQRDVELSADKASKTVTRSATTTGPDGAEYSTTNSVTVPDVNRTVESELDTETGTYSRTVTTEVNDQTTSVTRGASVSEGSAAVSNARTVNGKTVAAEKSAELDKEADTLSTSTTVTGPDGKQYNKETVRQMVTGAE